MPITVQSIIQRVVVELNDETSTRWTVPELVRYFNDGQRDIASNRPDIFLKRVKHQLTAGARQTIPQDGSKVISILANSEGSKGAISLVSSALLDAQARNWRSGAGSDDIQHYTYDPREPTVFEVYPPALSTAKVELEYSALPVDVAEPPEGSLYTAVTGTFGMGDLFANAMQNYILFRCYSKDTEFSVTPQRAQFFYQAYGSDLGIELRGTVATAPNTRKSATPSPAQ